MTIYQTKALTFDTGGTILDWHSGFAIALAKAGANHQIGRDWHQIANELRRRSLRQMLNLGEYEIPQYNFDDAHRLVLDDLCAENGLESFTEQERRGIWWDAVHTLSVWPDFPAVLPCLREKFICVSFTVLSYRIVIDTAKKNGLSWDAVISCEGIGKYKILQEAYLSAARYLRLKPSECCMVACHNFDLNAAKLAGFKTAFVRRPHEWGEEAPPDPIPNPTHDIVVDDFPSLARILGVNT
jgi:2-haloacid dehalogenase